MYINSCANQFIFLRLYQKNQWTPLIFGHQTVQKLNIIQ